MVKLQPGTSNMAYTSANLQLHTDMPYYHYKPGVSTNISAVFQESCTDSVLYTEIKYVKDIYLFYAA
jgi:gamma-butyrobetaine dioxygenase